MASTIKVNNIQNQCGANIANKCGTTITLGASGDTISLACGASQTGFGRTGTVDWDTTAKTASFTAVSGNGYFVNTTSGAITLTLPASPSAGDIVSFKDYAYTFATNNLTVAPNGSNIGGEGAANVVYNVNGTSKTFIYVDGTKGWLVTNESTDTSAAVLPAYVAATGGTITCCGDYKIHTFTGPGTFTVTCAGNSLGSNSVDYLVVAGGGGGSGNQGGAGGAGGYRESSGTASGCYGASPLGSCVSALPVTATGYPITVGGGGAGGCSPTPTEGVSGSNSIFSSITSAGGGHGSAGSCTPTLSGGSGGGARSTGPNGLGNTPPVSPPQGNPGGPGVAPDAGGAGGGGAGAAGTESVPRASDGAPGGNGVASSITGSAVTRAGGGAGGWGGPPGPGNGGTGGSGGGGNGGGIPGSACAGATNTGGGGGAGANPAGTPAPAGIAGAGGSGIVIIRYKYQ